LANRTLNITRVGFGERLIDALYEAIMLVFDEGAALR
jgi:hypothetical protein